MSLIHEHNGAGGDGGKMTIESPDESIRVTENGNVTEIETDWSKLPIESENQFAHVSKDAEGVHLAYDLVTEEQNGIARAFDKKVLDHSFANTANMAEVSDADNADYFLADNDPQYLAENGQIVGWQDQYGTKHLSRYTKIGDWDLPKYTCWGAGVFDELHGTLVVIQRRSSTASDRGPLELAVRNLYGNWRLVHGNLTGDEEIWSWLEYGNGMIVAMSGNSSMEIAVSRDGGYTWEKKILPVKTYWLKIRYNSAERKFFCIAESYLYATSDFETFDLITDGIGYNLQDCVFDSNGDYCVLARDSSNVYLLRGSGTTLNTTPVFTYNQNIAVTHAVTCNGYCICYNGDARENTADLYIDDIWGTPTINRLLSVYGGSQRGSIYMYEDSGTVYVCKQIFNSSFHSSSVAKYSYPSTIVKSIDPPSLVSRSFLFKGKLFLYDGDYNQHQTTSSTAYAYDLKSLTRITEEAYWEELPQIPEDSRGLLGIENKEVYEAGVETPYLKYENRTIKANASDRFTDYANYRLERVTPSDTFVLWCQSARNDIVDGTTKVYSDEDCTDEAGIIHQHNYNPNNPNDVEVIISGVSYVYNFIDSTTPVSLATTKALIDALNGGGMANFGIQNKSVTITTNGTSTISPDAGKLLNEVEVNVSVSGGGGVPAGNSVWHRNGTTDPFAQVTVSFSTDHYVCAPNTAPNFQVAVTSDGNAPAADSSNVVALFLWTAGSTFGIDASVLFDDGVNGVAPVVITL